MTTFSQFVDDIVQESKRPDMRSEVAAYLNQTIREVHFRPDTNSVLHYKDNFRELQIVAAVDSGATWTMPNPATFQTMLAVQYADATTYGDRAPFSRERLPQRNQSESEYFHYRVGDTFVFSGYGQTNSRINLGYFEYPARLKYFIELLRPATFDDVIGWTYLPAYDVDEASRLLARKLTTNWLIQRWYDVIAEGVRAKIFKRVSDEVRQRTSYALYQQLRQGLWTSEIADLGGIL